MTSIEAELLQHQYIYVPWVEKKPIDDIAAPVALHPTQVQRSTDRCVSSGARPPSDRVAAGGP